MSTRMLLIQAVNLGLLVTSPLIFWRTLMLITGSESPMVVILSGIYRGDILLLHMGKARTGDLVVFFIEDRDVPIAHRVIKVHEWAESDTIDILTKGDDNYSDDIGLYAKGQEWINPHHILGRAFGILPQVGYVADLMFRHKYALIGVVCLLAVTHNLKRAAQQA